MNDLTEIAQVVSVAPKLIELEIFNIAKYRQLDEPLKIGSYIEISDSQEGEDTLISIVKSFRVKDELARQSSTNDSFDDDGESENTIPQFLIGMQPVGRLKDNKFTRGANEISIPPKYISIASKDILQSIYGATNVDSPLSFGKLAQESSIDVNLDGDKFFGKHIGVVGSTGAGKSSTVAAILQEAIKKSDSQTTSGINNNSHILIFDLHGEYSTAFPEANILNAQNIVLPYWLMNSEELEEMFIESNEQNSHNQVSQFRSAVIANKKNHNQHATHISYDDSLYFSLDEVITFLTNLNNEVIGKTSVDNNRPKLKDGSYIDDRYLSYFQRELEFIATSTSQANKAIKGPFSGEFDRFLMRLKSKAVDDRINFLLKPTLNNGNTPLTQDLPYIMQQILGYKEKGTNVTIFDLSGVPFEVLSIIVSLISRLVFTFCTTFKRFNRNLDCNNELPFLIVLEEAHNYISRAEGAKYNTVRKSIERIAKEGRKYGLSLMIVSQRPAEISETIFSQCNNFVSMRLTNPVDQNYVKRLLPDDVAAVTDSISSLGQREALIIGDSVSIPTLIKINEITDIPSSSDVYFKKEWDKDWNENGLTGVIEKMTKKI